MNRDTAMKRNGKTLTSLPAAPEPQVDNARLVCQVPSAATPAIAEFLAESAREHQELLRDLAERIGAAQGVLEWHETIVVEE